MVDRVDASRGNGRTHPAEASSASRVELHAEMIGAKAVARKTVVSNAFQIIANESGLELLQMQRGQRRHQTMIALPISELSLQLRLTAFPGFDK